jgi:hypothetical protein
VKEINFSDQDFYYKRKENGVHLQFDCIPDKVFFPWVFLNASPFQLDEEAVVANNRFLAFIY